MGAICWCGNDSWDLLNTRGYRKCAACGTWMLLNPLPSVDELSRFYTLDNYWHDHMSKRGWLTIEKRVENDLQDGRIACWLRIVNQYCKAPASPGEKIAVEVGCAHGLLLDRLWKQYDWGVYGVEPDAGTADWVHRNFGVAVIDGMFPEVLQKHSLTPVDLFLAMDVLEHAVDPLAFMRGAYQLLKPEGIAIIQTPMDDGNSERPFGNRHDDCFEGREHLYIFTRTSFEKLCVRAGFQVVNNTERWQIMHEIIVLQKKEDG